MILLPFYQHNNLHSITSNSIRFLPTLPPPTGSHRRSLQPAELPRPPKRHTARGFPRGEPDRRDHTGLRVRREGADSPLAFLSPDRPCRLLPSPCVPFLGRGEPGDVPACRNVVGADPRPPGPDDRASPAPEAAQGVTGKVFSRTSFGRDRGGSRLSPSDCVLVLCARLRGGHPILRDLGCDVRVVEPPPSGVGWRLRGNARPRWLRNRWDAPLSKIGARDP